MTGLFGEFDVTGKALLVAQPAERIRPQARGAGPAAV